MLTAHGFVSLLLLLCDRYILLYVMQEDRNGGGYSTLIDTEVLLRYLSPQTLYVLMHTSFELSVPPEFFKGQEVLHAPLVSPTEKRFQYRFASPCRFGSHSYNISHWYDFLCIGVILSCGSIALQNSSVPLLSLIAC